ncbi:MAG: hypothetical protein ACC619_01190 [Paracoccaceae bacterium]
MMARFPRFFPIYRNHSPKNRILNASQINSLDESLNGGGNIRAMPVPFRAVDGDIIWPRGEHGRI